MYTRIQISIHIYLHPYLPPSHITVQILHTLKPLRHCPNQVIFALLTVSGSDICCFCCLMGVCGEEAVRRVLKPLKLPNCLSLFLVDLLGVLRGRPRFL